jgi:orotate phosphoribosyltransferase
MDITPSTTGALPALDGFFSWIILAILGVSTIIFVAESVGFLPNFIRKRIMKNRASETIDVLKDIGFDVEKVKRQNRAAKISEQVAPPTLSENARRLTNESVISKPLKVGRVEAVDSNSFIDLMGSTCNSSTAVDAAQQLSAHWRNVIQESSEQTIPDFDFVAAPKSGSPLIAYEFAKLQKKPLIFHNENLKFTSEDVDFAARFDAATKPAPDSVGIIIDDSTTGGRKGLEVIEHLRDAGYQVHDFLVIFEPLTKQAVGRNASARLKAVDVRLHSIIETE